MCRKPRRWVMAFSAGRTLWPEEVRVVGDAITHKRARHRSSGSRGPRGFIRRIT